MINETLKKKINKAIVRIIAESIETNPNIPFQKLTPSKGQGTGFFIDKNGHILTCAHVINESKNVFIEIPHLSSTKYESEVIFFVPEFDIALLKIKNYKNKEYIKLGDSEKLKSSDEVFAVGFPKSIGNTKGNNMKYTLGIISGHQEGLIQTDTSINPGNSGGPLFLKDKVIGINSIKMIGDNVSNIGYAVPINYYYNVIKNKNIVIERPLLNCIINNIEENIVKKITNNINGVYISKIYKNSIFNDIKDDFILTKFGDYSIDNFGFSSKRWLDEKVHISNLINFYKNNDLVPIEYIQNQKKIIKKIKLEPKKELIPYLYSNFEEIDYLVLGGGIFMNLTLNNIMTNKKLLNKIDENNLYDEKLILSFILPNSIISVLNNFENGDVISEVNNKKVKNLKDFKKALKEKYYINKIRIIKLVNMNQKIIILDYNETLKINKLLQKIYNFKNKNII